MTPASGNSVANGNRTYKLVLLFDGKQVTRDDLQRKIDKALAQVPDKKLTVKKEGAKHVGVYMEGSLEVVDRCHDELSRNLLNRRELRHFRLEDEAGDEIRLRAYPILSAIEQQMRAFINRVMVEVLGFEYWRSNVPQKLHDKIERASDSAKRDLSFDPLEFTQFDDLLDLLRTKWSSWSTDRPLTPGDLAQLLTQSKTIEDIRVALAERTKVISLWDDVFARYFRKPEDKDTLNSALDLVITQRHKVMHHRPVRLGVLTVLQEKAKLVSGLLRSAKEALSPEERREAKADVEKLWRSWDDWSSLLKTIEQPNPHIAEILDAFRRDVLYRPDPSLAAVLDQVRHTDMAFPKSLDAELLRQASVSSEQLRRSLQLMTELTGPSMEAQRRAIECIASCAKASSVPKQEDSAREQNPRKNRSEEPSDKTSTSE
jgi:hypothetical protein